ncbi:MAG: hypothetical protein JWP95_929 [Actinotalea sp.]|nr:hypothetical protein [Actinotalea sp.]
MLRLTLAQMRRSIGRLAAAGIAIGIGTAFVAATLLAGAAMTRTTYDAVTTAYAQADLVVVDGEVTDRELGALGELSGVRAVHGYDEGFLELVGPDGQAYTGVRALAADASLEAAEPTAGALPAGPGEIVLPQTTADVLGVEVGRSVRSTQTTWTVDDAGREKSQVLTEDLEVVGVLDAADATFMSTGGVAVVTADQLATWQTFVAGGMPERYYWYALLAVQDGAAVGQVQTAAQDALGTAAEVRTIDEHARQITAELTGDANQLVAIVLGFAAVALLVAALVIANTFQVLVAQRTRTLALLRCVGADRGQLRRSVVIEALVVGAASSLVGLVLGVLVVQGALVVLDRTVTDVPLPTSVTVTPAVVLVPLALGVVVTLLAALAPARAATRVSPLAALRPSGTPKLTESSGRVRGLTAGVLVLGGALGLVLGMVVAARTDMMLGLALGLLGGATSFIGVVLGAVFWVPRLVGAGGRLLGASPTARLAAANSVRNPRRTAATISALFIGVTLVSMMSTGAASTRAALGETLGEQFPVDVSVGTVGDGWTMPPLPTALPAQVEAIDGVSGTVELTGTTVTVLRPDHPDGDLSSLQTRGVDPQAAARVVHAPDQLDGLDDSTVLVPADVASWSGIVAGDLLQVQHQEPETVGSGGEGAVEAAPTQAPDGPGRSGTVAGEPAGGATVTLTAVLTDLSSSALIVTPGTVEALDPGAPVNRLWVALDDLEGAESVVAEISQAASDSGESLETVGAAVEAAFYERVVRTLLAIVVGLLGVAVVIALVGVANTLSLSVLERRRESATLRALGLTRSQLRGTLAIEGVLIAGVGSVVGALLGILYGWAGARTLLSTVTDVELIVPWGELAIVVTVGLLAGLLASVLPGRSAARTSPVEALAVE